METEFLKSKKEFGNDQIGEDGLRYCMAFGGRLEKPDEQGKLIGRLDGVYLSLQLVKQLGLKSIQKLERRKNLNSIILI